MSGREFKYFFHTLCFYFFDTEHSKLKVTSRVNSSSEG